MEKLIEISKNILKDCMGLKQDELFLVITDTLKEEIGCARDIKQDLRWDVSLY